MSSSNHSFTWKWTLYDWANSAFATSILAGFLPIFFKQYWATNLSLTQSTQFLGLGHTIIGLLVAGACLGIGLLVTRYPIEKQSFALLVILGVASTASLAFIKETQWLIALVCFGLANIGFSSANTLYDAQLISNLPASEHNRVSSLGYSLGYAGGGLLLIVHFIIVMKPTWFGINNMGELVSWVMITVAIWWLIFALPLMRATRHHVIKAESGILKKLAKNKNALLFLTAFWFYMDGVWTIIKMAVDYGLSLGFSQTHLLGALLVTQLIGFPATILIQKMFKSRSTLHVLMVLLGLYFIISLVATTLQSTIHFYVLAAAIGCIQGSVQALSRSFFGRLIDTQDSFAAFGFYNLVGKFSAILGPLLIVMTQQSLGPFIQDPLTLTRFGISSISLLFVIGILQLIHLNQKITYNNSKH